MKKLTWISIVSIVALFAFGPSPASAIGDVNSKKFANCAALNKVYPGGVAKSKSSTNRGGSVKYAAKISPSLYKENKTKDRDGDGIACER